MPRFQVILAATLMVTLVSSGACAGDFVPRATNSFAAIGDDPGARSSGCAEADAAAGATTSEPDTVATMRAAPSHTSAPRSARHIGVDDASDTHSAPTTSDADDKQVPAPAHKARSGLRWQSLLPGVMK
jgi:hypothetical protein